MFNNFITWMRLTVRTLATIVMPRPRVPVVMQMGHVDCGPACLAMILGYHGCSVELAECREACGSARDGATAKTIGAAARRFGLRTKAYTLSPADLPRLSLPIIAHWEFDHFVVVERWSPMGAEIVDPGMGRRELTAEEFDAGFTGVVLTFEPGNDFQHRRAVRRSLWRNYLQTMFGVPGIRGVLTQVLTVSVLLQLFGLAMPLFTQVLVDDVLPQHRAGLPMLLVLGMGLLVFAEVAGSYLRSILLIHLQSRVDARMMLDFFEHVLSLPFEFFQQRSSGDLMTRLGSNALIRNTLTGQTLSVVLDGTLVLVYLGVLCYYNLGFMFLAVGIGALQVLLLLATTRRVHLLNQRELIAEADSQGYLVEALTGIATLKATGGEERALTHWSNLLMKHLNSSLGQQHLEAAIDTASTAMRMAAPLALLAWGANCVIQGTMTLGTMLALDALAMAFLTPLGSLFSAGQRLQLVGAYLERIADVLEASSEQDPRRVRAAPRLTGRIELRNVGFRYGNDSPWVLRNINFTIEPGKTVAVVGLSGSGKSTLAKLVLGLYPPTEGTILFDGIPLTELDLRDVRGQLGVVLQESFLFSGTIRQNIAMDDPATPLDDIVAAARAAAIHDDIANMPMQYETLVGEGGSGLSGGQRQRLSLARALSRRPAILILDEATSHLDAVNERRVEQHLASLAATRVVIAHRLSTVRNADVILVLEEGQIVESGTHEVLIAKNGVYGSLVNRQAPNAAKLA